MLQKALQRLVERRAEAELKAAAETIRYRGPKTRQRITELSRNRAHRLIGEISHLASDPDLAGEPDENRTILLTQHLQTELLHRYDKGILSLAERYSCPLMWSHYGDQHSGICIGYSVSDQQAVQLHKVKYGGNREIGASRVAAMLDGELQAQIDVDSAVLLRKARAWGYEKEWRLMGRKGLAENPLELADVTFGLRCNNAVKFAVMSTLQRRSEPVKFYEMREERTSFRLRRRQLSDQDFMDYYPITAQERRDIFELLDPLEEQELLESN